MAAAAAASGSEKAPAADPSDASDTRAKRGRPSSRARILAAASELAHEVGAGQLSLDAVAARAGVSKGGLLYNFPTKVELLRALVAEHVARREAQVAEARERQGDAPNALIQAVIVASAACETGGAKAKPSGILAAIAADPLLLDPVREHMRRLVGDIRSSCRDPDLALIALFALEGLRTHDLFEHNALTAEERRRILARLKDMAD
jgi:AcrR family transcriptional regulator